MDLVALVEVGEVENVRLGAPLGRLGLAREEVIQALVVPPSGALFNSMKALLLADTLHGIERTTKMDIFFSNKISKSEKIYTLPLNWLNRTKKAKKDQKWSNLFLQRKKNSPKNPKMGFVWYRFWVLVSDIGISRY